MAEPRYFETPAEFRAWLQANHATAAELLVGFHKVHTHSRDRRCITWPQSVAEALCFGWIDGLRRRLDDERYTIRFTPRRKGSVWSAINIRMIATLETAGRMTPAGRAAFDARPHKTGPQAQGYTYQRRNATLPAPFLREFKKNKTAWAFFRAQPPGYRGLVSWWVTSAKQEATRQRRLARLIETSAGGKRLTW
jgi:uncharacterized protein YdeI (YjbR/CyaY-like superfamily)